MTLPAAALAGPSAVAVAGAWFFPWLVAAIAYYHSVSKTIVLAELPHTVYAYFSFSKYCRWLAQTYGSTSLTKYLKNAMQYEYYKVGQYLAS